MAILEMKVPSPGESITEVMIAQWLKEDGEFVVKDEEIAEIDSDKATLTINAEESGMLKILAKDGETVAVGDIICSIDTSATPSITKNVDYNLKTVDDSINLLTDKKENIDQQSNVSESVKTENDKVLATPLAKKIMAENKIQPNKIKGTGTEGRIMKRDVLSALAPGFNIPSDKNVSNLRTSERIKMSPLRKKLAQRLVRVKNETAMLTTFNEVDMNAIFIIRTKYKDEFKEVHGVNLGFMSFFTKAVTQALKLFPAINARIDGDEIIYHNYADIGIAVSASKGLMVPIIRNAEQMSFSEIEFSIKELALKARENKITIEEMTGGTFTITNGGVFGSMLSTPIINPPQSAILGMHNVIERPIAIDGKVVIRPMMFVALSYDHRIIDGSDSVGFLKKVKELLENPSLMLFNGKDPEHILLNI
jgi:2-oxoglutarate dehydrogenase E2 component (dihydrolipoamide succinyltransferase)